MLRNKRYRVGCDCARPDPEVHCSFRHSGADDAAGAAEEAADGVYSGRGLSSKHSARFVALSGALHFWIAPYALLFLRALSRFFFLLRATSLKPSDNGDR
jgi:hypothetical protein